MLKFITVAVMAITLTGCYALKPVAWVADEVCENRTETENAQLCAMAAVHPAGKERWCRRLCGGFASRQPAKCTTGCITWARQSRTKMKQTWFLCGI